MTQAEKLANMKRMIEEKGAEWFVEVRLQQAVEKVAGRLAEMDPALAQKSPKAIGNMAKIFVLREVFTTQGLTDAQALEEIRGLKLAGAL
jgi:hypothetical protein